MTSAEQFVLEKIELAARRTAEDMRQGTFFTPEEQALAAFSMTKFAEQILRIIKDHNQTKETST